MSTDRKPLRLWPGVVLAILQLVLRFVVPAAAPDQLFNALMGSLACSAGIILWWLLLSRAPWVERLGAIVLISASLFLTRRFLDVSIATGAMGMLFPILAIPTLTLVFVAWAAATSRLPDGFRRVTMVLAIVLVCGVWAAVRTGGFTASLNNDLHWRWTATPEDRLVAQAASLPGSLPLPPPPAPATAPETAASVPPPPTPTPSEPSEKPAAENSANRVSLPTPSKRPEVEAGWPGFRGPHRDGIVTGVKINTDWKASPPVEIWRKPIGPGWSSFSVRGDLIYTQEQRGPEEVVACYRLTNGAPVWAHRDQARFWESNGGPGPRGTPTLSHGRAYTFGATGIVNVLNADDGSVVWSRNAAADAGVKTPEWGFASSPLVVDDLVIVGVAGRLVAYDLEKGTPRWMGPARGVSYSSPMLLTTDGIRQVLLVSEPGLTSLALSDGTPLWEHAWKGYPIVQPAVTADGDVLISMTDSSGIRRITPKHGADGWKVEERWTSMGLKPYFNDFVVHNGYAYGFDGAILSCIDLADGKRKWKGGRYGNGQMVLLGDQDVLLVSSEEGDLALVQATPDQFTELARVPALEGKTWNHPVVTGSVLLVRNGQEMVAFRLSPEAR